MRPIDMHFYSDWVRLASVYPVHQVSGRKSSSLATGSSRRPKVMGLWQNHSSIVSRIRPFFDPKMGVPKLSLRVTTDLAALLRRYHGIAKAMVPAGESAAPVICVTDGKQQDRVGGMLATKVEV